MDFLTIIGVVIGFAAIIGGNFLEGGHIAALANGPAALIVLGGTIGAAVLQTPRNTFSRALEMGRWMLKPPESNFAQHLDKIVRWSQVARRDGLLGLEKIADQERDPFALKGLRLLVDGNEPEQIRAVLEVELISRERHDFEAAKVYEAMGGYAPTIGIIGAVMGLIHVMGNLADPSRLGDGIAVAFVATIYGVGIANLLLLPMAAKLRSLVRRQSHLREMVVEGLLAISDGENPRSIALKLRGFFETE